MFLPWYLACRAISNHTKTWRDVLENKEITNWIFTDLRGYVLDVPPSLKEELDELVKYCQSTDISDVQLYCGCVILKQCGKWDKLMTIAKSCKNEKLLKVVLENFHATGEEFPHVYTIFIDVLQDSKWSSDLHSQCVESLEWGLAWCLQPNCTAPSMSIVKNCILNAEKSQAHDASKQKLRTTLLQELPEQMCKDLISNKILICGKVENSERACIVPNFKRAKSDSMHHFYKTQASLQDSHKSQHCACHCDCSDHWFRLCSEA
jgi:hypothetical protein